MKSTFFTGIVVVLIGAISGVYFYRSLFQSAAQYSASPTNSALQLINRLEKIKINRTFFDDPDYKVLQMYPQESLEGIEKGRSNPYVGKVRPLFVPDTSARNLNNNQPRQGRGATTTQSEPFIE
jgi:hypothetical protein